MALTKAQLEALKNELLASGQPITAATHRAFIQNVINEMYDAQSRGNLLAGVQADGTTTGGDEILLIRSGQTYLVPASLFGGGAGTLAGLGDVIITDPQDEDILSYDAVSGKWINIALTGLYVTQAQLDAALAALQLPEGARLIDAELILTSTTAGTITARWVDFLGETESVTNEALSFNGGGLPSAGNFRFDIVQGNNAGAVSVKQGTEGAEGVATIPTADTDNVVLAVVLWSDSGTSEVNPPGGNNTQQTDWSLIRFSTAVAPNTTGKLAKVWEGNLSRDANFSIELAYAEPKNGTTFVGSGAQLLKLSFTCDASRNILSDTVQLTTGQGSTAGEFVLYQISGNKAALYHKANHYWSRIQFRILFQNSQVRLQDFINSAAYGSAPGAPVATFNSTVESGGGAAVPPVAQTYANLAAMIADQGAQEAGYIYADDKAYYEYLGTTLGTIADYRRIAPADVPSVAASYASSAVMIADQANQLSGWLYFDGNVYWEYLGTTVGDITDYRQASDYDNFIASSGSILFDAPRKYGFTTAVTGNLTAGTTGAKEKYMAKVLHNDTAEPTVSGPGGVTIVKDGGTYEASADNIIYFLCHKNDAGTVTKISYTITNNQL